MPLPRVASFRVTALALLLGTCLLACGGPPATGAPDAGSTPPDAGNEIPDAGPQPVVDPPWDGMSLQRRWLREGFGEANALRAVDVDADGHPELVYGGRGLALVDREARELGTAPRWSFDWDAAEGNVLSGGENTWVESMEVLDVDADGAPDVLALTSDREAYAVDGRTGQKLWSRRLDAEGYVKRVAVFDTAEGPAFFAAGGKTAYLVRDGSALWASTEMNRYAVFVTAGDVDGDGARDVVATTERDWRTDDDCALVTTPFTNVYALKADGTLLFSGDVEVPCGGVSSVLTANVDDTPAEEVLVGTTDGKVHVLSAAGVVWTASLGTGWVQSLAAGDVDGDGRAEVYASLYDGLAQVPVHQVVALTAAGAERFRVDAGGKVTLLRLAQVDGDAAEELLVGGGETDPFHGLAMVVDVGVQETEPAPEARIQWRQAYGMPVRALEPATLDGTPVLLVGGVDARVHALAPDSGQEQWAYTGGGYVTTTAAGDVDGDGEDEVASGDDRGVLMLADGATGRRLWARQMDVGIVGEVLDVAVADLTGDGKAEVVAIASRYYQAQENVVLEVYGADGTLLLQKRMANLLAGVVVADLEGDGAPELVLADQSAQTGACGVRVMTLEGQTKWASIASSICITPHVAVGNADDDAALEIGYGERTWDTIPTAALFQADGTPSWFQVLPGEQANTGEWVAVERGALVYGGLATDGYGRVTKLEAVDGAVRWQTSLRPYVDTEAPGILIGGGALYGTRVDDRDGDGVSEWALTTVAGDVHLLDGASGATRWTRNIAPREVTSGQRHMGGPIAFVPATATQPPFLVAAQMGDVRKRSEAFVLRLDGEVRATFPLADRSFDIAVGRLAPGQQPAALVGAGLGVYAYEGIKGP